MLKSDILILSLIIIVTLISFSYYIIYHIRIVFLDFQINNLYAVSLAFQLFWVQTSWIGIYVHNTFFNNYLKLKFQLLKRFIIKN